MTVDVAAIRLHQGVWSVSCVLCDWSSLSDLSEQMGAHQVAPSMATGALIRHLVRRHRDLPGVTG